MLIIRPKTDRRQFQCSSVDRSRESTEGRVADARSGLASRKDKVHERTGPCPSTALAGILTVIETVQNTTEGQRVYSRANMPKCRYPPIGILTGAYVNTELYPI